MSRGTIELDLEKNQTNNTPNPKFQKLLNRRRSFREIQGAITKIDPEIIKSLLASSSDSSTKPRSIPSTPRQEQRQIPVSLVHAPLSRPNNEVVSGTEPMTIFYNGTVSVFQVSRNKADEIIKVAAKETVSKRDETSIETDLSVILPTTLRSNIFGHNLDGDLPIARRKSLQRFFEKRKKRLIIADVVTALSYLANQPYDPNKDESRRNRDERGAKPITRSDEAGGSGSKLDLEGSEKEDSPRETAKILNRDINRERAVAEAKMWGESLREKRRQSEQGTSGSNSTG